MGDSRQIEIDRKTPVEVEELRRAGVSLDVLVPVAQSRWAALSIAMLIASFIWCVIALGPMVFWATAFIVGLTTYIWFLRQAARFEYETEEGEWERRVTAGDVVTALLLTLLIGFVAWSLWRVISFLAPELELSPMVRKVQALLSLLSLIFSVSFFIHLELAFIQELAQRSPFQEQFIWEAVGELLKGRKKDEAKETVRVVPRPVPLRDHGRVMNGNGGNGEAERTEDHHRGNGHRTVMAPSGVEVTLDDLTTFIRLAPRIGTSFRVWKERGWDYQRWGDVLDVWAVFGVVEERRSRHTSEMLVTGFDAAMALLTEYL